MKKSKGLQLFGVNISFASNTETELSIPNIDELAIDEYKQNALVVVLNKPPLPEWIKPHPIAKNKVNGVTVPYKYIPRERLEYILTRVYSRWWLEVKSVAIMANSIVTVVRVYVIDPITGKEIWQDGVGASPIQTDKGAGAIDFNSMKSGSIQMAAPASETYAFKDAAEKFGKLFGKDLNVDPIEYDSLLKHKVDLKELKELYKMKKEQLPDDEQMHCERIIKNKEESSYQKMFNNLKSK